jgi:hypothetical protein
MCRADGVADSVADSVADADAHLADAASEQQDVIEIHVTSSTLISCVEDRGLADDSANAAQALRSQAIGSIGPRVSGDIAASDGVPACAAGSDADSSISRCTGVQPAVRSSGSEHSSGAREGSPSAGESDGVDALGLQLGQPGATPRDAARLPWTGQQQSPAASGSADATSAFASHGGSVSIAVLAGGANASAIAALQQVSSSVQVHMQAAAASRSAHAGLQAAPPGELITSAPPDGATSLADQAVGSAESSGAELQGKALTPCSSKQSRASEHAGSSETGLGSDTSEDVFADSAESVSTRSAMPQTHGVASAVHANADVSSSGPQQRARGSARLSSCNGSGAGAADGETAGGHSAVAQPEESSPHGLQAQLDHHLSDVNQEDLHSSSHLVGSARCARGLEAAVKRSAHGDTAGGEGPSSQPMDRGAEGRDDALRLKDALALEVASENKDASNSPVQVHAWFPEATGVL